MPVLGYFDINSEQYDENGFKGLNLYKTSNNAIERGADWLYAMIDTAMAYDFNIYYYMSPTLLAMVMYPFNSIFLEIAMWENSDNIVEWARQNDAKTLGFLYQNPYLNEWTQSILNSIDRALILYIHPETYFFIPSQDNAHALTYTSSLFESIYSQALTEGYLSPIFMMLDVFLFTYVIAMFVVLYFSYYTSSTTDETTIDQDFFVATATVEAEEEITSIEDISLTMIVLIFVFGWYFYINSPFIVNKVPELSIAFYGLPFLYYVIIFMPTFLIYDFGIFFLSYLRGAATTSSLVMELLYDYIAFAAFYVRLAVQNVRLLLMLFTYFSLYECIITYATFYSSESLWQTTNTNWNYSEYSSYYFLLKIPTQLVYWLYELLHTFFVITAQFIAFFAMVFWLFLFLYTMFVSEQQEKYFSEKKEKRKKWFKKLWK